MRDEKNGAPTPLISVIVPIRDGETLVPRLFERLYPVLDGLDKPYELILVDDGSRDRSATLLRQQHKLRADVTRVLMLRRGLGREAALLAGLRESKGERVVTLGANLRTPPESIRVLLDEMDRGHDYVGGVRRRGLKTGWRRRVAELVIDLRERLTGVRMRDPACSLRIYDRDLVEAVLTSADAGTFVPALAYLRAANPTEIEVDRAAGTAAEPGLAFLEPVRLDLELLTSASPVPLRAVSVVGIGAGLASLLFALVLVVRDLVLGADPADSSLLGVVLFLAGLILLGIGLMAAYLGRLWAGIGGGPPYLIREHLRPKGDTTRRGE